MQIMGGPENWIKFWTFKNNFQLIFWYIYVRAPSNSGSWYLPYLILPKNVLSLLLILPLIPFNLKSELYTKRAPRRHRKTQQNKNENVFFVLWNNFFYFFFASFLPLNFLFSFSLSRFSSSKLFCSFRVTNFLCVCLYIYIYT